MIKMASITAEKDSSQHVERIDGDVKQTQNVTTTDDSSDEAPAVTDGSGGRMNRAKWLACIAMCLSYTTAYQQNACTAAIVNHINAELGELHIFYLDDKARLD